jgi:hypothetical protein
MFSYRPLKGNCWGHAIYPRNTLAVLPKMYKFFTNYFEPFAPEELTINLNRHGDKSNYVPVIREKLVQVFGRPGYPESMDWVLAPADYQRAINLILECPPSSKQTGDPLWLSFKGEVDWRNSALPKVEWPEEYLLPGNEKWRRSFFMVNLSANGRITFPMGINIPIPSNEHASYDFLARFSADAPFKMKPDNFSSCVPVGDKGKWAFRKLEPEFVARLQEVIK